MAGVSDLLSVVRAVHEISMVTSTRLEPLLARLRLTQQTAQALWAIDPDRQAPPMRVVAQRLHCNASNVTFIAKQLEERGYVVRRRDPQDGRSSVLVLTPEGERVRREVVDEALALTPFAALSSAELAALADVLTRVADLPE
ncbi:MarR family transcriptional regulator [Streptomyces sp. WAC 01420]|uniref:MarR family winged helix-turn-helix transcriptional regulator n=1 Tax=Streptomyces sp. WAC 01438 TaxID=2203204 RepID=UPI000F6EDF05|nr:MULTISPECIES: MarR family transcriptional regulator [unclassified Streptomyces]AZM61348.1 MarR family transcriptional regulator [Streptomyces sp. WAC 01438]RSM92367.1 MarR family transcriptional regulator [Streptomyces sp. WAC 01420]